MANPHPDIYTIRVGAKAVDSPTSRKPLYPALTFEVVRKPAEGKGYECRAEDPHNVVIRPGDFLQFEVGDVTLPSKEPRLTVEWKAVTGKEWPSAPRVPGKPGQLPPKQGFGRQIYSYTASLDLGLNVELPAQRLSAGGTTVVTLDPDVGSDDC